MASENYQTVANNTVLLLKNYEKSDFEAVSRPKRRLMTSDFKISKNYV